MRFCLIASCSKRPSRRALSGVPARDSAEHETAGEPVLGKAALRFARAIEARNDLAVDVHRLGIGVGAQPGERVVVEGQQMLRPGAAVRPKPFKASTE